MRDYKEYKEIKSGDKDIDARVVKSLKDLSREPQASIQASCGDIHQAKAVYRLLSNPKFKPSQVRQVSVSESVKRMELSDCATVLVIQDSSAINYPNLIATEGLGTLGKSKKPRGIVLHSALSVGINDEIYGLLGQEAIVREAENYGTRHTRAKKPIESKESYKWIKMMEATQKSIPAGVLGVHVSDREGDIYEYFERAENIGSKYLCRRTHNRKISSKHDEINYYIESLPEAGVMTVHIPRDSHTKRKARKTTLSVKFGKTDILRPANLKMADESSHKKLTVYVISAVETDVHSDVKEPISWQLITNLPISNFEDAVQKIDWYTKRWRIEDFHYTLKSGCSIEKRQASSEKKLEKLIALYSVIAVDIMRMTWVARVNPNISCETLFSPDEWRILYCVANKTKIHPENAPTVRQAIRFIAILGGFSNRNSDGEPGLKSIWLGLSKFHSILFAKQFC